MSVLAFQPCTSADSLPTLTCALVQQGVQAGGCEFDSMRIHGKNLEEFTP